MTGELNSGRQRFDALLAGASEAPHDQPLLERDEWLVAPTLGAIIPNWLLVLPRRRVLSFRDWASTGGTCALTILAEVQNHLGLEADDVIWFEHGPTSEGTLVGCGLDHAHLHILVRPGFSFASFAAAVRQMDDLHWCENTTAESYSNLADASSYCVAGSGNRAISAIDVERVGSQFFRRVVSSLSGDGSGWDYRRFAHSQNIEATIANFRRLERAAACER